jgi:formylglycine-generating enzyme
MNIDDEAPGMTPKTERVQRRHAGSGAWMRAISGGRFVMGSNNHYPEEAPERAVVLDPFWIDEEPITNAEFEIFVRDTGYVTFAERAPDPALYPNADPKLLKAGSAVFVPPNQPVRLDDASQWWDYRFGADWRHPLGPGSSVDALQKHPVVHIAFEDAAAYAAWAQADLPTEAEWEYAAQGGLGNRPYAWGTELAPSGQMLANYWQGEFPWRNLTLDGYLRTSPVGAFPPNGYGLLDMIGNVWEWTSDWYASPIASRSPCCAPKNPRGASEAESLGASGDFARKVLKGGSHLCAPNFCQRYRPAARYPQPIDTTTSHVGFRCVRRTRPN